MVAPIPRLRSRSSREAARVTLIHAVLGLLPAKRPHFDGDVHFSPYERRETYARRGGR